MIKLEFLEEKDIESIIEWNKDKASDFLIQWSGHRQYQHPLTKEQIQQRLIDGANKEDSNIFIYKILSSESDEMIGTIELSRIDRTNLTARVCRFLIGEEKYRGKGIGKIVLEQVLKIGFTVLKFKKMTLGVYDFNIRAIKCYEKVGFKKVELIENAIKAENGFWNSYQMEISREEWLNSTLEQVDSI